MPQGPSDCMHATRPSLAQLDEVVHKCVSAAKWFEQWRVGCGAICNLLLLVPVVGPWSLSLFPDESGVADVTVMLSDRQGMFDRARSASEFSALQAQGVWQPGGQHRGTRGSQNPQSLLHTNSVPRTRMHMSCGPAQTAGPALQPLNS